jgi:hypothetical protein
MSRTLLISTPPLVEFSISNQKQDEIPNVYSQTTRVRGSTKTRRRNEREWWNWDEEEENATSWRSDEGNCESWTTTTSPIESGGCDGRCERLIRISSI